MKTLAVLTCICTILFFSCSSGDRPAGDFKLLPQPQEFKLAGSSKLKPDDIRFYHFPGDIGPPAATGLPKGIRPAEQLSRAQITCSIEPSMDLDEEGYTLEITRNVINITAKDGAGLLYAFMTLQQLMEDAREQDIPLPLCSIRDFPLLSYRAIHIDVKHHRETMDYYYRLMDKLARYKVNAVIAEMEDKLKYERQPVVGSADALSMEQWKDLSDYAMERNIEISPLIQGLGHASFILKHERYRNLRDDPQSDWAFNPLDPGTYEVQYDLYLDALEATPYGRYLHIGGDEVHTTGRSSGKSIVK